MDDLELRRHCVAEPRSHDPDYRQLLADNPAAQHRAAQAEKLDRAVHAQLMGPAVPEGLNARILLRAGMQKRRRFRWTTGLALAASVLIAVSLVFWTPAPPPGASFGQMALAHVHDEISHLEHLPSSTVADSTLRTLIRELGAELVGSVNAVRFAYICPTPQGPGLHLITDGPTGPVTVLYVPGAQSPQEDEQFADARFVGLASAAAGGSLAVIGETATDVRTVSDRMSRQLRLALRPVTDSAPLRI